MFTIYANDQLVYEPGDQELLVLQPKLVLEMGAAGSLEFSVPPGHPYYSNFNQLSTVVYAKFDSTEVFRGRVLSSSRDFYNFRQTYCEGALSYLVDSVQKGEAYQGSAHGLFRQIISNHNRLVDSAKQFTVGNITVPDKDIKIAGKSTGTEEDPDAYAADYWRQIYIDSIADNWSTSLDYINTCLIDYLGGYLMVRRVGNTNYIDWVQEYATTATQEIEFGTNLLDMTEEISADDLFTVLIPIGDENLTIASVNGGSIEIADSNLVNKYGRIVRTEVFGSVNQASTLLENGRNYLAKESSAPITFTIKAVDLSMIDSGITAIRLGDRVKIKSEPHNINQYYTCTKIEYDLENPENTVFTFGNPHQSLTQRYRRDKRKEQERANYNGYSGAGGLGNSIANPTTGDTKKKLDEFFDAWINVTPDQGKIDLGAVYRKLEGTRTVLENNVGINFDAPKGTIDIYADHTEWVKDRQTLKNDVGIDLDATTGNINIVSTATAFNDRINAEESATAAIKLWSGYDDYDNLTSKIALEADVVEVHGRLDALEADFNRLTTNTAAVRNTLYAKNAFAENFYIDNGGEITYNIQNHTHDFEPRADGTIHIKSADWTGADHYFNIADTIFYQNGVSARTPKSVQFERNDDNEIIWDQVSVVTNGDGSFGPFTLSPNPYTSGYNSGIYDETPTSIGYDTTDSGDVDYGSVWVKSRNNTTKSFSITNAYILGRNSVPQRSVSRVGYSVDEDGNYNYNYIDVTFSDNTTQTFSISPNAYNVGHSAGYSSGANYGFSKGGYRTVYVTASNNSGAQVMGYYYRYIDSTYQNYQYGWGYPDPETGAGGKAIWYND